MGLGCLIETLIGEVERLQQENKELAARHLALQARVDDWLQRTYGDDGLPPCPGPSWYWVKGHWRSHGNGSLEGLAVCAWETERWAKKETGQ